MTSLQPPNDLAHHRPLVEFQKRVMIALALIGLALFMWKSAEAFLIFFAGVVLAVVMGGFAYMLRSKTHWTYCHCLYVVTACVFLLIAGIAMLVLPMVIEESKRLLEKMPAMIDQVRTTTWGRMFFSGGLSGGDGDGVLSRIIGPATRSAEAFTAMALALVIGIFLAYDPEAYARGMISILPLGYREKGRQVLLACGRALWHWLIGQGFAMLIIGTLVTLGMVIVGAPFALVLGPLAGLFQFVPNVGPVLWAFPAILIAFSGGEVMAIKVLAVYIVIQVLEGNFITPMVLKQNVQLPPVLTLLGTIVMGMVFGPLGLILGTPLTVILLVCYRMLYQRDLLHDESAKIPGQGERK
ncbi:MAG: AI-2E family transporter [Verrucomicrobiota bacterium JB022]|nr:AI-2E family transporter [Verrucomicrobiota bacterium JB022]